MPFKHKLQSTDFHIWRAGAHSNVVWHRTVHESDTECDTSNVLSIVLTELQIMAKCTKQLPVF